MNFERYEVGNNCEVRCESQYDYQLKIEILAYDFRAEYVDIKPISDLLNGIINLVDEKMKEIEKWQAVKEETRSRGQ